MESSIPSKMMHDAIVDVT